LEFEKVIKNNIELFEKSEIILKESHKNKTKKYVEYSNTKKKIEDLEKQLKELKKTLENDRIEVLKSENDFKKQSKNIYSIQEKITEVVNQNITFYENFKVIFNKEEDCYRYNIKL
jgi:hypothetical protein